MGFFFRDLALRIGPAKLLFAGLFDVNGFRPLYLIILRLSLVFKGQL